MHCTDYILFIHQLVDIWVLLLANMKIPFIGLRKFSSVSSVLSIFIMNRCEISLNGYLCTWVKIIMIFLLYSLNIMDYID